MTELDEQSGWFESMPDDELVVLQQQVTAALEARKKAKRDVAIEKIKADMAANGLTYRDFIVPSARSGGARSPRSSDRTPKYGINKMLPALQVILKDGPIAQAILRDRLKTEYDLPLNVIGMLLRYGYIRRNENGDYELTAMSKTTESSVAPTSANQEAT